MNFPLKLVQFHCKAAVVRFASNGRINHYDSLGVTTKATQADIKSAYYKLSMVYHPDKNKDSEGAAQKFRSISEAYEILGNARSRKMYDRGLIGLNRTSAVYDEPENKFYRSREVKSRPPAPTGKSRVYYDFDEWSRAHYGKTFDEDMKRRERVKYNNWKKEQVQTDERIERTVITIGLLFVLASIMMYSKNTPYDRPAVKK